MATMGAHYDLERFGAERLSFSPRQADLLMVMGTIAILARVALEGDRALAVGESELQKFFQFPELAVGQRVHRVDDDGLNAVAPNRRGERGPQSGRCKKGSLPEPVPVVRT